MSRFRKLQNGIAAAAVSVAIALSAGCNARPAEKALPIVHQPTQEERMNEARKERELSDLIVKQASGLVHMDPAVLNIKKEELFPYTRFVVATPEDRCKIVYSSNGDYLFTHAITEQGRVFSKDLVDLCSSHVIEIGRTGEYVRSRIDGKTVNEPVTEIAKLIAKSREYNQSRTEERGAAPKEIFSPANKDVEYKSASYKCSSSRRKKDSCFPVYRLTAGRLIKDKGYSTDGSFGGDGQHILDDRGPGSYFVLEGREFSKSGKIVRELGQIITQDKSYNNDIGLKVVRNVGENKFHLDLGVSIATTPVEELKEKITYIPALYRTKIPGLK